MRLGTCLHHNEHYVFIQQEGHYYLPALAAENTGDEWRSLQTLIAHPQRDSVLFALELSADMQVDDITLLAPLPRPNKNIICMGLNYFDHIAEAADFAGRNARKPTAPIVFTKSNACVIGPDSPIPDDPEVSEQLDWEVELAIVIGKTGKKIPLDKVHEHIFAYTIVNDISARDLQFAHKQFYIGKSIDGGCPMGPVMVTADEIADPQALALTCRVNGIEKQAGSTAQMIFDIPAIVSILSRSMTLEAGDVIATGTPDGVGFARKPPEFLKSGDVVECEIESIGILRNPVV